MHTRWTIALVVMLHGMTSGAAAQRAWQSEVGIRGGFTRGVTAGAGADPTDVVSLPGFNLGPVLPLATAVYAVVPWRNAFAVEADASASQLIIGTTATFFALGLRGDYAVTKNVYVAAGGDLGYSNGVRNDTQFGVQAAVGYRRGVTSRLNAHVEVRTIFWGKTDDSPPADTYSLLLGVGATSAKGRVRGAGQPGAWVSSIGVAGGYATVRLLGGGSLTSLAFPSYGSALGLVLVSEVALPPTVFVILPLSGRIALEPGLDVHRFQEGGQTSFSGNFSARVDYAVHRGWYGAAGANLHYLKSTGVAGFARTGVNVGGGYRFGLSSALGGRVELNYTMFARNRTFGVRPSNTVGLMIGVSAPLR